MTLHHPPERTSAASIDPRTFRTVMGHYPTGVCIITASDPDGRALGMTVGTFTSVSLDPPLVGFFPDRKSTTWPAIAATGRFCVNVLADDQQQLCLTFASRGTDKFAEVIHNLSENGQPILDRVAAWIDCTVYAVHEAGDHYLVLGEVQAMGVQSELSPLLFVRGQFARAAVIETAPPGQGA